MNTKLKIISEDYNKLKQMPLYSYFMILDIFEEISKIKNIGNVYLFGSYSKLIFKENSDNILQSSYTHLKKIALILKKKDNYYFILSGYSEYLGNPLSEYQLSQKRAKKLIDYFVLNGIQEENFQISSSGNLYNKSNKENKPKRIIKLMDK